MFVVKEKGTTEAVPKRNKTLNTNYKNLKFE